MEIHRLVTLCSVETVKNTRFHRLANALVQVLSIRIYMYSEPNLHSRNLKLVSLFFILYWFLGLKPIDDSIRLLVINYEISNPSALHWASYAILFYFAWRFYLSSQGRIRAGYRKSVSIGSFPNKETRFYKKLVSLADEDYFKNKKLEFEETRLTKFNENPIEGFNNELYKVHVTRFFYESKKLMLTYQVQYSGSRLAGNDCINAQIRFRSMEWLLFKFFAFLKFSIKQEDAPDYLLPWVLFTSALVCGVLSKLGISANCLV